MKQGEDKPSKWKYVNYLEVITIGIAHGIGIQWSNISKTLWSIWMAKIKWMLGGVLIKVCKV